MYGSLEKVGDATESTPEQQQQSSVTKLNTSNNGTPTGDAGATGASNRLYALGSNPTNLLENSMKRKRIYSHCHVQQTKNNPERVDKNARRRLIAASMICLVFMIAEVIGGVLSNSLAIATDAAHLLTDFASFMISIFALWLSTRPASRNMSFGWYRAEVIGALLSVLMIWLVTGLLVYMAIERIRTKEFEIDSLVMVITASAGLLVNIIMAVALNFDKHSHGFHNHSHHHGSSHHHHHHHSEDEDDAAEDTCDEREHLAVRTGNSLKSAKLNSRKRPGRGKSNINVRAAFIHVIGDFLQSLGVLIAALVIYFEPSYTIVDPICTFIFSIIVLITTLNIIRDAVNVLMEGIPDSIDFIEVRETLQALPCVIRVHNLRIWSLSLDKIAISAHLVINDQQTPSEALKLAIDTLKSTYNFFEVTIQVEDYKDEMRDCEQCQDEEVVIDVYEDNHNAGRANSSN